MIRPAITATALIFMAVILAIPIGSVPAPAYSWGRTLEAIRLIETGGLPHGGLGAHGDDGRAAGPYQIHEIYHTDAAERDTALTGYAQCATSKAYSERVIFSYMGRYAPQSRHRLLNGTAMLKDVEMIARIHNGGPRGSLKRATLPYWSKVHAALLSQAP